MSREEIGLNEHPAVLQLIKCLKYSVSFIYYYKDSQDGPVTGKSRTSSLLYEFCAQHVSLFIFLRR